MKQALYALDVTNRRCAPNIQATSPMQSSVNNSAFHAEAVFVYTFAEVLSLGGA